jgi:hypothetical protein
MGEDACVDTHIVVDSRISVSEGHVIGDEVRDRLKSKIEDVADVLVHIDPEDDEFIESYEKPLTRQKIQKILDQYFAEILHTVDDFRIHYLNGRVEVEVVLPQGLFNQTEQVEWIKKQCIKVEKEVSLINKVYVFFKV